MIRFLYLGLIRDRSRSLFPLMTITTGAFLTVFLFSWMQGVIGDMVSTSARFDTGHVKVMTRSYSRLASQCPNDLALMGVGGLLRKTRALDSRMVWTPRIRFGGLLDVPDEKGETRIQAPVIGLGIDLLGAQSPETRILGVRKALVRGAFPGDKKEAVLSEELTRKMGLGIGDTVTLIGSTMYGEMATFNFKVAGTVRFGITALDRGTIIADISAVREALDMDDASGEIVGYSRDMVYRDEDMKKLASTFNRDYSRPADRFSPLMLCLSEQNSLGEILALTSVFVRVIISVFVLVMSLVLWNSGLMNQIRRYGEIGLRLALGEPRGALYRRLILEGFLMGLIGSILGTALGLGASYYLQYHGLDFGRLMHKSTMMISNELRASVTPGSYFIGFVPALVASLLGNMAAGIGIYRRKTSELFKELET
jgi:putative ABC transport system permease protein